MADRAIIQHSATIEDLLEKLCSAHEGGLKLDTLLVYAVAGADLRTGTLRDVITEGSFSREVTDELLDDRPPPFTRSLDAVVPGENIVLSTYSDKRGQWAAVQREADGREFMSWAATEALARRAAALQAFGERLPAGDQEDYVPVASLVGENPAPELRAVSPEIGNPKPDRPRKEEEPVKKDAARDSPSAVPEWQIKF